MKRIKMLIMGAAGRDFHNFNVVFRDNELYDVVAFTATQIPDIDERLYPPELAGKLYPDGIPIHSEDKLPELIEKYDIEQVWFSYSDVPYDYVMSKGAAVQAEGPSFGFVGPGLTMLEAKVPVIAVCAVRTGCGKSQTTRRVAEILKAKGKKVVVIRHPMPYGNLRKQIWQRFETLDDLDKYECTIEEREEYEPHIMRGNIVYAGVDYGEILKRAESEADIILWDGGNNDTPFYKPDLHITVVDPHRAGDERFYFPGEINLRMADAVVINKMMTADRDDIMFVRESIAQLNPKAKVIDAASPLSLDKPELIRGKKVLAIEDGPTLTHGEMQYGAGIIAAEKAGAAEFIDPRPFAVGTIAGTFEKYPNIGTLLPAMGYSPQQIKDLEKTIDASPADVVVIGTPIDLRRIVNITKPTVRVSYELQEIGHPDLEDIIEEHFGA